MRPRQPFSSPAPSGSAASCPAAPIASAKAGARSSVSSPISPSTLLAVKRSPRRARAAASRRCGAVQIVEGQPAALQRHPRGQIDILRQRSVGLRSSSGARLTLRTLRLTLALASCAQGSADPCASASSPRSRQSWPAAATARATRRSPIPRIAPGRRLRRSRDRARAAPARTRPCSDDSFDSTLTRCAGAHRDRCRAAPRHRRLRGDRWRRP